MSDIFFQTTDNSGQPIVLIHGSFVDHLSWVGLYPHLQDDFCLTAYDRRGYGKSSSLARKSGIADDVRDLIELVEHLDQGPVHAIGNSMGGIVLLRAVIEREDLFQTISIHESAFVDMTPEISSIAEVVKVKVALDNTRKLLKDGKFEAGTKHFLDHALSPQLWEMMPPAMRDSFVSNSRSVIEELETTDVFRPDLERLRQLSVPMLFTRGQNSPSYLRAIAGTLSKSLPHAELVDIEGAGHTPQLSQPEIYAEVLKRFYASRLTR